MWEWLYIQTKDTHPLIGEVKPSQLSPGDRMQRKQNMDKTKASKFTSNNAFFPPEIRLQF